jgi:hypothetical protein
VAHVLELINAANHADRIKPSPDEQRAIDTTIRRASIALCQNEGFTQAQLDCVLAAHDLEQFSRLGACAAIKDRRPSWLSIP